MDSWLALVGESNSCLRVLLQARVKGKTTHDKFHGTLYIIQWLSSAWSILNNIGNFWTRAPRKNCGTTVTQLSSDRQLTVSRQFVVSNNNNIIDVFVGCQCLVGELSANSLLSINRQLGKLFFKITKLLFYLNNNLHGVVLSPVFTMEVYWNFTINKFLKDGEDLS